jgi:hypothetical protein
MPLSHSHQYLASTLQARIKKNRFPAIRTRSSEALISNLDQCTSQYAGGRLGRAIGSLSYTVPIGESFSFTVAFGASRRKLIELELPADDFSTDQIQEFGQLEWEFSESLSQRWSLVLGLSASSSRTTLVGQQLPPTAPEIVKRPQTGYLRLGLSGGGQAG